MIKSRFHYAYLIVASCIVTSFIPFGLSISCSGIFFTPVSEYFGVPRATFTLYFSILNIFAALTLPFAGKLMSRVDNRIVMSVAVALIGGSLVAMSFFTAVWHFYIAGALLGIGLAPVVYLAVPKLMSAWFAKRVGFFTGLCLSFSGVGGVVFNPIGTALIQSGPEGWRLGYLVFGIITLVVSLPFTVLVLRDKPADKGLTRRCYEDGSAHAEDVAATPVVQAKGIMASKAMKTSAFLLVGAFAFLMTLNCYVAQFLPSYCLSFADTAPDIAVLSGLTASAAMLGQTVGKVIIGAVNDKSSKYGLILGCCGGAVGILCVWLLPMQAAVLLIGSFLFGFAYACPAVQSPLLTRSVFGDRDYTNIWSRISTIGVIGGVIAPVLLGVLIDMPGGFTLMFMLSIVFMLVALVAGFWALARGKALLEKSE